MKKIKILKKFLLISSLCLLGISSFGQKTEFNINAYTTFFGFKGNGATNSSYVNGNHLTPEASAFNVYGKNGSFSYEVDLEVKRITKQKYIYGLGIGWEAFNSRVNIDTVRINDINQKHYGAYGKTMLNNSYINVNPFVGKRILNSKITFDILLGMDLAFCINSLEKVSVRLDGTKTYETFENKNDKPLIDYRARAEIKARYYRIGLLAGYSLGLTDYQKTPNINASTKVFRLGIGYTIN